MNKEDDKLEVNKKNREDFENLVKESSIKKDGYWDSKNPIVKFVLIMLGLVILAGVTYYITAYFINR